MDKIFLYYLLGVNVLTVLSYGMDKLAAKMQKWRIPEKVLLSLVVIGGSIGAMIGMYGFHHKTRKAKFYIGVPVILFLQLALAVGVKIYF